MWRKQVNVLNPNEKLIEKKFPCNYFLTPRGCNKGDQCTFSHINPDKLINDVYDEAFKINPNSKTNFYIPNKSRISFLSKKFLQELKLKSLNEIIQDLSKFPDLMQSINNTDLKDDYFYLLIDLLVLICPVNSEPCKMILTSFIKSSFFDKLGKLFKDSKFIVAIIHYCKNDTILGTSEFFLNCIKVFEDFIYKFYSDVSSIPIENFRDLLNTLSKYPDTNNHFTEISIKVKELEDSIKRVREDLIKKEIEKVDYKTRDESQILITYKDENLNLTKEEILNSMNPMIQRHRVKGDYESWERYLNTMFYLVREDCYRSLRKSINSLAYKVEIDRDIGKTERDIYYYKSVKIIDLNIDMKGIIFTVSFETFQTKMSWSKRLLHGSLLVLTLPDLSDMVLSTVIEGPDPKKLPINGKYYCKISLVDNEYNNFYKFIEWNNERHILHMFESKAYYESYRHILKRIQDLDARNLPFEDVIINYRQPQINTVPSIIPRRNLREINITNIDIPKLNNWLIPSHFSIDTIMKYDFHNFYLYRDNWPSKLKKTLDDSQLKALQHGLRNKVAIIQGPPGTGKTFVGALITQILLNNSENPILIVCYTNHALDQFLKHILAFETKILRIGGRCKDPELANYSLNYQKQHTNSIYNPRISFLFHKIKDYSNEFKLFCSTINQKSYLSYDTLHQKFNYVAEKIISDFFIVAHKKVYNLEEDIYEAWINSTKLENLANKLNLKNENRENFLYYFNNLQDMNFKININRIIPIRQVNNQMIQPQQEVNEDEEDEEDVIENLDRIEVEGLDYQDYLEGEHDKDETKVLRDLEELKINEIEMDYINGISTTELENIINSDFNLWRLSYNYRVAIMNYYKRDYVIKQISLLQPKIEKFNRMVQEKRELHNLNDIEFIKKSKIVGMTTSGCAKYSTFLEQLNFETVIIEEAAEVLESHIAAIITRNTKHLILIGDHQQLKPSPYNYEISKQYCFDVSLFERLINNEVPYVSLEYQRRMRPEFADFVRLIYTKSAYADHDSTKNKPNVKGFTSNVFFLNHQNRESVIANIASKSNLFEASFVAALANYITQQNVKPEKITILTLYIAQVLLIREELKKFGIKEKVKVVAVDNYQGEENDFILLSLVRSNKENQIGFLKSFNRVCVAFSRAILGFYVLGDFKCLMSGQDIKKESNLHLWTEICKLADSKKIIDNKFTFKCQKHQIENIVEKPDDFKKLVEGGCKLTCKERLECGHVCEYYCHNFEHERKHCNKPCMRTLTCGHVCTRKCNVDCGKCITKVRRDLKCGHSAQIECHLNPNLFNCKVKIPTILKCGHRTMKECWESEDRILCYEDVNVTLHCGHEQINKCHIPIEDVKCNEPCGVILDCKHICKGSCSDCLIGSLHLPCSQVCNRVLICSHECKKLCSQPCLCDRSCENVCLHGYCNLNCKEECYPCMEECPNECDHGKCGNFCHDYCNFICDKKCTKILNCGHQCMGLCNEECPNICRTCDPNNETFEIFFGNEDDNEAIFFKLDCTHVFELKGLDEYMGIGSDNYSVQAKSCPKCRKPIVFNNRYSNITKKTFKLIQDIKKVYFEKYGNYAEIFKNTRQIINENIKKLKLDQQPYKSQNLAVSALFDYALKLEKKDKIAELVSAYNFCCISEEMFKIEIFNPRILLNKSKYHFNKNLLKLKYYFNSQKCFSARFLENFKRKIHSLYLFTQVCDTINKPDLVDYSKLIENSNFMLPQNKIDALYKIIPKLSQEEMMTIMNSIEGGRWYNCPNGHLYSIGECGRPMEESRCPECASLIGGRDHSPHANNNEFNGFN